MPYQQWSVPTPTSVGNEGFRDLVDSLTSGIKAGNLPRELAMSNQKETSQIDKLQQDIKASMLKNILEEKYGAKEREADIGY